MRREKRQYFIKYTVLFWTVTLFVYGYFFYFGKSFVECGKDNNADGLVQHYTALCYYAKYLRQILKQLLTEHQLIIPQWSFSIGYGSDILTTLHYYVIGDPFNLLSVLVPLKYMPYYYSFMILARMYFAGLAFSLYCMEVFIIKSTNQINDYAILAGSIVYVFGLYGILAGISHPYFINPMIYLPLLLLGIEKILKKKNSFVFMFTVAVSACSNFYFFYMLVIFTIGYAVMRLVAIYGIKDVKAIIGNIWKIGIRAVIGLGSGMILFLPVINTVFADSRFGNTNVSMMLFPSKYYTQLLAAFISPQKPGYWCLMGFAAIVLIAIVLMFVQKERYQCKVAFACLTAILLIPVVNCALNGFSYVASRWIWAYAFVVAVIVVNMWPAIMTMKKKEAGYVGISLITYALLCFIIDNSRTLNLAFAVLCAFSIIVICQFLTDKKMIQRLILGMIIVNISMNGYFLFSYKSTDTLEKYGDFKEINQLVMNTFDNAVIQAEASSAERETDFSRFSQSIINNNATLLSGMYSTQYYWTLSNPNIIEYNAELGVNGFTHNIYYDLNSRTRLTTLANVKYCVQKEGANDQNTPYGFEMIGTYGTGTGKYDVYQNKQTLPFGYTYDSILSEDKFKELSPVQKEEAIFQAAYVEGKDIGLPENEIEITGQEIPYEIVGKDENVSVQDKAFVTTKDNASIKIELDGPTEGETFLQITGLTYQGCSPLELYKDDSPFDPENLYTEEKWQKKSLLEKKKAQYKERNWAEKDMMYINVNSIDKAENRTESGFWLFTPNYTWYSGKEDFTVNLMYSESGKQEVEIVFPYAGIYSYKDLVFEYMPIEGYENGIEKLKKEHLENVIFETNCIVGDITVSDKKLLCLSIPYTKGWTAYVDGKKTPIYQTNYMYSGIVLDTGEHHVLMKYETAGLKLGVIISIISICFMAGTGIWEKSLLYQMKRSDRN